MWRILIGMENLITYSSIPARVSLRCGIYRERRFSAVHMAQPCPAVGHWWGSAISTGTANRITCLYNESSRQTAIWYLNNNAFAGGAFGPTLPGAWRVVGVADFNRDGKTDYLLFNPSTHQSAHLVSLRGHACLGGAFGPTLPSAWALVGVGDFNGDGKPDYVLVQRRARAKPRSGT